MAELTTKETSPLAPAITPQEGEFPDRLRYAQRTIERQGAAIVELASQVGQSFNDAVELILRTKGRIVVSGMGKSGLIARKLVATFSSTGTPSLFLHPADAIHGDLGMIMAGDVVMLLSYSGETEEVVRLLPSLRRAGIPIIALLGKVDSTVGRHADLVLEASVESEVCPHGLAPTTSTLAAMAMGDVLAVTLMRERAFSPRDFAQRHPGGSLGRRLLSRVQDEMRSSDLPIIGEEASVAQCICVMTEGRLGLSIVMRDKRVLGIVTDGDLRRALAKQTDLTSATVSEIMTPNPKTVTPSTMVVDAEAKMQREKVKALIVVEGEHLAGVFDIFRK